MSEVLRLEAVRKEIGEGEGRMELLRGISLSVEAGEFIAIMGPSGSGKSSLLNLVGLLERPSGGKVWLLGQDVSVLSEDQLAVLRCRWLGFIFQNFHLLPYLTAAQNVALPMQYARRGDHSPRVAELLGRVSLSHRARSYPATLSGGERQRVAIARALANEPALLLADEPTGALDSKTGAQIMNFLAELHAGGATILMITHDEKIARRAQRVLVIEDGRLV